MQEGARHKKGIQIERKMWEEQKRVSMSRDREERSRCNPKTTVWTLK
jgi:hypothetical protein